MAKQSILFVALLCAVSESFRLWFKVLMFNPIFQRYAFAINCAFFYNETVATDDVQSSNRLRKSVPGTTVLTPRPIGEFNCYDGFSPAEWVSSCTSRGIFNFHSRTLTSRIGPLDANDPFDDEETSCKSSPKKIRPNFLHNTKNVPTNVLQSSAVIQEITIDECKWVTTESSRVHLILNPNRSFAKKNVKWEKCIFDNQPMTPPKQMHVCRNVHYRISLLSEQAGKIVNDDFYYPTNCVCELVLFDWASTSL